MCVFLGWLVEYVDFIIHMRSSLVCVYFYETKFLAVIKAQEKWQLLIVEIVGGFWIEWHLNVDMKRIMCMCGLKHGATIFNHVFIVFKKDQDQLWEPLKHVKILPKQHGVVDCLQGDCHQS